MPHYVFHCGMYSSTQVVLNLFSDRQPLNLEIILAPLEKFVFFSILGKLLLLRDNFIEI